MQSKFMKQIQLKPMKTAKWVKHVFFFFFTLLRMDSFLPTVVQRQWLRIDIIGIEHLFYGFTMTVGAVFFRGPNTRNLQSRCTVSTR